MQKSGDDRGSSEVTREKLKEFAEASCRSTNHKKKEEERPMQEMTSPKVISITVSPPSLPTSAIQVESRLIVNGKPPTALA